MGAARLGLPLNGWREVVLSRKRDATLDFKYMGDPDRDFLAITKAEYHLRRRTVVQLL
jgi:hypothetical protein